MGKKNWKALAGRHASRRGACSAGLTALAVAAVLVADLLLAQLPSEWTQFDLTDSGIYDITEVSQEYLEKMDQDVEIRVLAAEEDVDSRIVRFLDKYVGLNDHLSLEYSDPLVYPSVRATYGVESGTVVVTCEATGRQESFALSDIIGFDLMSYYYYGAYQETDFDAEGLLTSAIDSVLTGTTRTVYQTEGHDETALPSNVEELFERSHMAVETVNLLLDGGIPDDCSVLILSQPLRDLADDELDMILEYLSAGGQVIYLMASQLEDLPNLDALCAAYGMQVADGLIADTSRSYQNVPYQFFPLVDTSVDAASGLGSDPMILFTFSRGFTLTDPARDTITVQSFLTTSEDGYSVTDETDAVQGTYTVGAVATEEIDDGITARLTVYGSGAPVDETIAQYFTNLDNVDLFMDSATIAFPDVSDLAIDPVSLSTPTNTITTGGIWALLFIFIIPAALLIYGFIRWMHRRKL